jgi:hypothetical protein
MTMQGITVPAGSYSFIVFEFEIFVYIPDHIVFDLSFIHPKAIILFPLALKTAPSDISLRQVHSPEPLK